MKKLIIIACLALIPSFAVAEVTSISVLKDGTFMLRDSGVINYLLTDESIASVSVIENKGLLISGNHLGSTILHVWNGQGRTSYKLVVDRPDYVRNAVHGPDTTEPGFKFGISAGRKIGTSTSEITANRYEYVSDYYVLDGYGNTQLGFLQGQLGYAVNKEDTGTSRTINKVKLALQKDSTRIAFGDQEIRYSDYVLPYQDIQGLSYSTRMLGANVSLVYGVNRYGWWGEDHYRDYRPKQYFSGLNILVPVDRSLSVGFNSIFKQEKNTPDSLVGSVYGNYKLDRTTQFVGELALNRDKKAVKAGVNYDDRDYFVHTIYRSTSQGYREANDYINYDCMKGFFVDSGYKLSNILSFSGKYGQYVDSTYDSNYTNQDMNTSTYLTLGNATITHTLWRRNRGDYAGSGIGQGQNIQISYLAVPLKSSLYAKYSPSTYESNNDPTKNYSTSATIAGIQFTGIPLTTLTLEKQWNNNEDTSVFTEAIAAQSLRAYLSIPQLRIYTSPFYLNLYARYQEDYAASARADRAYGMFRSRLEWVNAADQRIYLEGVFTNIDSDEELQLQRELTEISFGTTYFFDSGVNLTAGTGSIKGTVYIDLNGNGAMEANENGVPGVKVTLSNGQSVLTDSSGAYSFTGIKGAKHTVYIDPSSVPKGYIFTTTDQQVVQLDTQPGTVADFGLSSKSVVRGRVFVDSNNNGTYDAGEQLIPNVRFEVQGVDYCRSDANGAFVISGVPSGKQVFVLDIHTLPLEYSPAGPVSRELDVVPGESIDLLIPLQTVN